MDDIPLLDLFDDRRVNVDIAHKKAEVVVEEAEVKKKDEDEATDEYKTIDLWDIAKYALAFIGGGFVIHKLLASKEQRVDPNQQIITMMFLIYQSNMQLMTAIMGQNKPIPPPIATPAAATIDETKVLQEGNKDWLKWFEDHKGQILDRDELMKIDELGIRENWRVQRDLKGKVLNVYKVNDYLA